jgi:hypothetical protein
MKKQICMFTRQQLVWKDNLSVSKQVHQLSLESFNLNM